MSFNHQWHKIDVALLWPQGSVVLLRNRTTGSFHKHAYLLISNWNPTGSFWSRPDNEYQLIEEPKTKDHE